ncbi:MAG: hypothetical protein ABEJ89_08785 [Haloarculaceae archaeon]
MSAQRDDTSSSQMTSIDTDGEPPTETDDAEEEPTEERRDLALDHVFELLKNSRRREVLTYLNDVDDEVAIGDLAEHIAAIENDTTVEDVSSSQRKRVYVGLYQCHLPKMDDMDVVEFNKNRGRIRLGPNAAELEEYLVSDDEVSRDWHWQYAGLAVVGAVLFGVAELTTVPILSPALVLAGLIVAMAGVAAVNLRAASSDED